MEGEKERTVEEEGDAGEQAEGVLEEVVDVAELLGPGRDALGVLGRVGRRLAEACRVRTKGQLCGPKEG